jgi:hypothetical protein
MKASLLLDTWTVIWIANGLPIAAEADGDAATRDRLLLAYGEEGHLQVISC